MSRKGEISPFYKEDIVRIQKYLQRPPADFLEARNKAVIALLLKTGIKTSVLASLNVDEVNKGKGVILSSNPKAPKQIVLDNQTREILINYLNFRKDDHVTPLFIRYKTNEFYEDDESLRLSHRQIQRIAKDFARENALLGDLTPKFFRHTLGIYYASVGVPSVTIDSILGNVAQWIKTDYRRRFLMKSLQKEKGRASSLSKLNFRCKEHRVRLLKVKHKKRRTIWICPKEGCESRVVDRGTYLARVGAVLIKN